MQLVTVFQTFSEAEAQLVSSRLEAADFPVHIANEMSAQYLGPAAAVGGIQVQVPSDVAEEARKLVNSIDRSSSHGPPMPPPLF